MWKYLGSLGITAIVAGALIFWLMMYSLSMVFPLPKSSCSKIASIVAQTKRQGQKAFADKGIWPGTMGHWRQCGG